MAILDSLKSKKLPIGVFAGVQAAPKPARIFITLKYSDKFLWLKSFPTFKFTSSTIMFEIPVMPPTVEFDTGNSTDSENVTRVGEIVLPKYQKAVQIRWESFFPYDTSAPYLNTTVRNLSWSSVKQIGSSITDMLNSFSQQSASPNTYNKIFSLLSKSKEPFTISMTFYDGGHLPATEVSLETLKYKPENNGDYSYNISLIEYQDIKPKKLNKDGSEVQSTDKKVEDAKKSKILQTVSDCWDFCKKWYPVVSKKLIWAFATYNGIRNLVFDGVLKVWKIKGSLQDLGGRFGILNNLIGASKITSKDTQAVSQALKKLSYTKASQQLAELLKQNMSI